MLQKIGIHSCDYPDLQVFLPIIPLFPHHIYLQLYLKLPLNQNIFSAFLSFYSEDFPNHLPDLNLFSES